MIESEEFSKNQENQRKILFCLINSEKLVDIFERKFFNDIKKRLANANTRKNQLWEFYEFYGAYLDLLAELSWDFPMGIDQAKRLVTEEQLFEILTSNSTPFFFKKHFLKLLHAIFLKRIDLNDSSKSIIEEILNLINRDLEVFSHYLSGADSKAKSIQSDIKIINSKSEYWDYILHEINGKEYGLLYFVDHILRGIKAHEENNTTKEFASTLMDIRAELIKIMIRVEEEEKENKILNDKSEDVEKNGKDWVDNMWLKKMVWEWLLKIKIIKVNKAGTNFSLAGVNNNKNNKNNVNGETVADKGSNSNNAAPKNEKDKLDSQLGKEEAKMNLISHIRMKLIEKRISYSQLIDIVLFRGSTHPFDFFKKMLHLNERDKSVELAISYVVSESKVDKDKDMGPSVLIKDASLIKTMEFCKALYQMEENLYTYVTEGQKYILKKQTTRNPLTKTNPLLEQNSENSIELYDNYMAFLSRFLACTRAKPDSGTQGTEID